MKWPETLAEKREWLATACVVTAIKPADSDKAEALEQLIRYRYETCPDAEIEETWAMVEKAKQASIDFMLYGGPIDEDTPKWYGKSVLDYIDGRREG